MSAKLTTDVDKRLLRTTKFPPEFNTKVDMQKIQMLVMRPWVIDEIARILKNDDDVVTDLILQLLDPRYPNIKEMQIQLMGFLDKDAPKFCLDLWKLLISAQANPKGVPTELVEAKKAQLSQEKAEEERLHNEALKRQEADRERDYELSRLRDRERNERGGGRGRGGRFGREDDRRASYRRDSRSPALPSSRRRDGDDFYRATAAPSSRGTDSYIPSSRRADRDERPPPTRRRRRSSISSSRSRSRSPPRRRRRRDSTSSRSRSPPPRRRDRDRTRSPSPRDRKRSKTEARRRSPSPARKHSHDHSHAHSHSHSHHHHDERRRRRSSTSPPPPPRSREKRKKEERTDLIEKRRRRMRD